MSESLEELQRQAAEINKKIAEIKVKGDAVVDAFIDEIKQPGTYIKWGNTYIIKPSGGYRRANKKSVEFFGKEICFPMGGNPIIIDWSSSGEEVKSFRKNFLENGHIQVFHDPNPLIETAESYVGNFNRPSDIMGRFLPHIQKEPDLDIKKFKKTHLNNAIKTIVEKFNGLVIKLKSDRCWGTRDADNEFEYLAFRVVNLDDGSVYIKASLFAPVLQHYEGNQYIDIVENVFDHPNLRIEPMDAQSAKKLVDELKDYLRPAISVVSYGEFKENLEQLKISADNDTKQFMQMIRKAILAEEK